MKRNVDIPVEKSALRRYGPWVVVVAVVAVTGFLAPESLISDYTFFQMSRVVVVAIAVMGLNLLLGWAGTISAGHGAIFGIGAYATAIFAERLEVPWPVAVLLGSAFCFLVGILLGLPAGRLGGMNLGLITIAIALVLPTVLSRWRDLTGGDFGIGPTRVEVPFGLPLSSPQFIFLISVLALGLVALLLSNLLRSRIGRALDAGRVSPALAAAQAVPSQKLMVYSIALSSAIAGLGGGLFHLVMGTSTPANYTFLFSIALLTASVVGGIRSLGGAIIGAAFITLLPQAIADNMDATAAGQWQQAFYAASLFIILYFFRGGVASLLGMTRNLVVRWRGGAAARGAGPGKA
jgi:branched-chain amino acid transport system permease protein